MLRLAMDPMDACLAGDRSPLVLEREKGEVGSWFGVRRENWLSDLTSRSCSMEEGPD